jgi:hypothetical protein
MRPSRGAFMPLPNGVALTPMFAALAYGETPCRFHDRERRLLLAVLAERTGPLVGAWPCGSAGHTATSRRTSGVCSPGESCLGYRAEASRSMPVVDGRVPGGCEARAEAPGRTQAAAGRQSAVEKG